MIGQIVGNYKIEEKLGEGGMGAVYKGVDTMLDREVAIKALKPELASQTSVVERFRTEAVTLAKLNHPNIATLYSMFRQGEELYMVLEYVRGETLDTIIQRRGALPAEEAIPVFCQVLDGIDHAHELGIVHRDIKPANMMLTEKGTLKVLDFGIARLLGSARMTRAGNIIGTLEYMAPEQVRGAETDGRSDLYALGMMLYEVLTGKLPFDTDNEFELMKAQTETVPPPPRTINPTISEEVEAAIMKAIEKDPDKRFQTGGEFREVLLDAGFTASGTIHGATGSYKRPATRPSRPSAPVSEAVTQQITDPGITGLGAATPSAAALKATRLGASTAPVTTPTAQSAKATRLGNTSTVVSDQNEAAVQSTSIFSKLTAVHYAGAGAVLLILLGAVVAIPMVMLSGSSSPKPEPAKVAETKPEVETQKPQIVTRPQEPAQVQTSTQVVTPPANYQPAMPVAGGELTPVENTPKTGKPVASAPKPAAPKQPAAPKPKGGSKSKAESLLTGP